MPAAYSLDLRQRVVSAYESGEGSQKEIAELFQIGEKTLQGYLYLKRDAGTLKPKAGKRGRKPAITEVGLETIQAWIKEKQDITLLELIARYKKAFKRKVSESMMSRACQQLGLTRKKKSFYAQEQEREDVKKT